MNTGESSLKDAVSKHGETVATVLGIGLLVTAASLRSPSLWLVLPAWLMLGIRGTVFFASIPKNSPCKDAFCLVGFALLFYAALWRTLFSDLFQLLFEPSADHLTRLIASRPFLVLVIIYLVGVWGFYRIKLRETEDSLERHQQHHREYMDIMKKECQRLEQKANERNA